MIEDLQSWIGKHSIAEIECIVPDINGILRGKLMPADQFVAAADKGSLRIPSSLFAVTLTGGYANGSVRITEDPDMHVQPDLTTLRIAPGYRTPTAVVFADVTGPDGAPWSVSPRNVLKRVLELYTARGWHPVIAPELEFYLTAISTDPTLPFTQPVGRSFRPVTTPQPYGLDALSEHELLIDGIYEQARLAGLELGTVIHESGPAHLEINFHHGEPLALADQVLIFKRIVRQVAVTHGAHATFMAKPIGEHPGSSMHLHVSVVDDDGINLFAQESGDDSTIFRQFVGGLQAYLPEIAALYAPTVNSFRRLRPVYSAPVNVEWGVDNRSCGLRVPIDSPSNRRVENRLPGADSNPYLAIAATLIAGWLGIEQKLEPTEKLTGSAYLQGRSLPISLDEAMTRLNACAPVKALLGDGFLHAFSAVKQSELDNFHALVTPWERDYLMLMV